MVNGRLFVIHIYNMRHGNTSAEDIMKAEMAKDQRRQNRAKGYAKMHERDKGSATFNNGVIMLWPVPMTETKGKFKVGKETVEICTYPEEVPEGKFVLRVDGESYLFDAEEFRRCLRWV